MLARPDEVVSFVSQLRHTVDRWAGKPFGLLGFQEDWLRAITRLDRRGRRKVRESLFGMARKNGKSTLTAGIGLTLLCLDDVPGDEIVAGAAKRDQGRRVHDAARRFVYSSVVDGFALRDYLVVQRDSIYFPERDSTFYVISADAEKELGLNPRVAIMDELAAHPNRNLYDAITTAQAAREDPLTLSITHAGATPSGVAFDMYTDGREIERGIRSDPEYDFRWFEADPALPIDSERGWKQANPSYGKIVVPDYLRRAVKRKPEYVFRRMHLNQWTTAHERWISSRSWDACKKKPQIPAGADVIIGIDAALRRDTYAVAMVHVDAEGVVHAVVRAFVPPAKGEYIDQLEIETYVLGLCAMYRCRQLVGDPAFLQLMIQRLKEYGLPVEEFPQSELRMVRAAETLQRVVMDRRLHHGGQPGLMRQMANVATRMTERGVRISKGRSGGPVDEVVALAMAIDAAVGEENAGENFLYVV